MSDSYYPKAPPDSCVCDECDGIREKENLPAALEAARAEIDSWRALADFALSHFDDSDDYVENFAKSHVVGVSECFLELKKRQLQDTEIQHERTAEIISLTNGWYPKGWIPPDEVRALKERAEKAEKERDELKAELERDYSPTSIRAAFIRAKSAEEHAEKAEAACAQLRECLTDLVNVWVGECHWLSSQMCAPCRAREALESSDAGRGWLSPEKVAKVREALRIADQTLAEPLPLDDVTLKVLAEAARADVAKALSLLEANDSHSAVTKSADDGKDGGA